MPIYDPAQLPPVDRVEIVSLIRQSIGKADPRPRFLDWYSVVASTETIGEMAKKIAALWRSLPPAEQNRCHIPPYGLRFYAHDVVILECSICWQCNNIHIRTGRGEDTFYTFDASHEKSKSLYALLKGQFAAEIETGL